MSDDSDKLVKSISGIIHNRKIKRIQAWHMVNALIPPGDLSDHPQTIRLIKEIMLNDCGTTHAADCAAIHEILAAHGDNEAQSTIYGDWERELGSNERGRSWFGNDGLDCSTQPFGAPRSWWPVRRSGEYVLFPRG